MKVFVTGPYNIVTKIEFCCGCMSKDVLLGEIKTRPWTDHPLSFYIGDKRIAFCPHCGSEIDGDC